MTSKNISASLNLIGELIYNSNFTISGGTSFMDNKLVKINKVDKKISIVLTLAPNERSNANDILDITVPNYSIKNESDVIFNVPQKGTFLTNVLDNSEDYSIDIHGTISNVHTGSLNDFDNKFLRLLIPVNARSFDFHGFELSQFKSNISSRNNNLIKVDIDGNEFHLITFKIDDKIYWGVDSTNPLDLKTFKEIAFSILNVYGFITGDLYLGETYILASDEKDFSTNLNLQFNSIRDSILSGYRMVTTNAYSVFIPYFKANSQPINDATIKHWSNQLPFFSSDVFSKLSTLFFKQDKLSRAALIILEANSQPLELKAASYCVAFEAISATVKDLFGIESSNVIDNDLWDKTVKPMFLELIEKLISDKSINEDQKRILGSKLNNWNQPTNRDKLTAPFAKFGYTLNKDEYSCVDNRNKFLHGSLPVDEKDEDLVFKEVYHISLTIHRLVYILMLKSADFDGYIINYPMMHSHITGRKIAEDLFLKI